MIQVLGHWQLYVLLAVSAVGLLLNQSAFQAGHVAASLPAIAVTVTVVSIVAMAAGTIALARSPLVTHAERNDREPGIPARS